MVSANGPRRGLSNDALLVHIRAVHAQSKGEYGWPRVWKELLGRGIHVGKQRVQKLMQMQMQMQMHGIKARSKRKYKATTDSNHSLPVAPNLLGRDFNPAAPNAAWSSDITYIATDEGCGCTWPLRDAGHQGWEVLAWVHWLHDAPRFIIG